MDKFVAERQRRHLHRRVRRARPDDGLLRRQHRHRRCGTTRSSTRCRTTPSTPTFGPSTPGALNLISGQTHGFREVDSVTGKQVPTPGTYALVAPDKNGVGTVINDPDPAYDDCSDTQPHLDEHPGRSDRAERRRPAQRPRRDAGAGSRAASRRRPRPATTTDVRGLRRDAHQHRRRVGRRLQPAPQPVRVLQVDVQPAPPARRRTWPRSATTARPTTSTT